MSETASTDAGVTCLLVEDNPDDARLIERYLREGNRELLPAEVEIRHEKTLAAAEDALESGAVDLLLLDLGLRESTGTDTFDRISHRTSEIPVIVLTGLRDEAAAVELLQRGAQDYLNKGSIGGDRLVRSIRYALERQEREGELRETTEQLEALNRILRPDIRNDLQALRSWTETLLARTDDEDRAETIERILATSEHILELTDNSREYIRLVVADEGVELESVRLDRVLREEVQKVTSTYPDADVRLADPPAVTVAANEFLSSVFRNLLNNAVRHNHGDAPRVEVAVAERDDTVRVTVADDGPGVPDDRKEKVFGKGERGLESAGSGIGLYLVHTLVTRFGGDVWVEDSDPEGAAFVVELRRD